MLNPLVVLANFADSGNKFHYTQIANQKRIFLLSIHLSAPFIKKFLENFLLLEVSLKQRLQVISGHRG